MSDAMNIKLTVADFEEMDANTLLGLHNKLLQSRDAALEERDAARAAVENEKFNTASMRSKFLNEHHLREARDRALVEYALQNLLGDDA
jgi:hypothetical protein